MSTRYVPKGYKVNPLSRDKIRGSAQTVLDVLRERMDFDSPMVPIVDVVEWLDVNDVVELDVRESFLMDGKAAELQPVPGGIPKILVNEEVYEGGCDDDYFSRFTLAHELGHYFLHSTQPMPLARANSTPTHKAYEDTEWQANVFAGELLVDSRLVSKFCESPSDIVTVFGVSKEVAEIQWKELKKRGIV